MTPLVKVHVYGKKDIPSDSQAESVAYKPWAQSGRAKLLIWLDCLLAS